MFRCMLRGLFLAGLTTVASTRLVGQDIGALTLQVGAVTSLSPAGDGLRPGLLADLSFVLGPFSLGPEIGVYLTGADSLSPNTRPESAAAFGGVTRFQFGDGGLRPHVVGSLGLYAWDSTHPTAPTGTYLSGSLGLGVRRTTTTSGSALMTEVRLHQVLQRTGGPGTRRFVALTVGYAFGW